MDLIHWGKQKLNLKSLINIFHKALLLKPFVYLIDKTLFQSSMKLKTKEDKYLFDFSSALLKNFIKEFIKEFYLK